MSCIICFIDYVHLTVMRVGRYEVQKQCTFAFRQTSELRNVNFALLHFEVYCDKNNLT